MRAQHLLYVDVCERKKSGTHRPHTKTECVTHVIKATDKKERKITGTYKKVQGLTRLSGEQS